jgi:zinc finger protein
MFCPICGNETLELTDYLYEVPLFGETVISVGRCSTCGYKFTDARLLESRGPTVLRLSVDGDKDLRALVVVSPYATVRVPELGLEMTPGPASTGFITTVEGVLEQFLRVLAVLCAERGREKDSHADACKSAENAINEAKEGKMRFTLVIDDPTGTSAIASDKVVVEKKTGKYEHLRGGRGEAR